MQVHSFICKCNKEKPTGVKIESLHALVFQVSSQKKKDEKGREK